MDRRTSEREYGTETDASKLEGSLSSSYSARFQHNTGAGGKAVTVKALGGFI